MNDLLTDKALEDFLLYYDNHSIKYLLSWVLFDDLPLIVQTVLIIEWFDLHKIYIDINSQINDANELRFTSNLFYKEDYINYVSCENRQDALIEGIKAGNKIYNEIY